MTNYGLKILIMVGITNINFLHISFYIRKKIVQVKALGTW